MPTSPPLIIDMRCLQDPAFAQRGIGHHARCIATSAPSPFIALTDPQLPPLPKNLAARAAKILSHPYVGNIQPGTIFLNPSPMGPDQNFIAPLLLDPVITQIACIYDFIPFDHPQTYLTQPIHRLDYFSAMALLRRYQFFLPISENTESRLHALYGDVPCHVTGVALPPWIQDLTPKTPRHILMVGGDDTRKNPETLAHAHAGSNILRDTPLVIAGQYSQETQRRLQSITRVEMPGRIPDAAMRDLYANALCLVAPSRAEGFSLPVIEAMAAATPAIVSDIPAHRALVPEAAARFAPDDIPHLTQLLEELLIHPARRNAAIAAQAKTWRRFTPDAIGANIWQAIDDFSAATPRPPSLKNAFLPSPAFLPAQHNGRALANLAEMYR